MEFQKPIHQIFSQLWDSLDQLTQDQYNYRCTNLTGHTIGQHVRHIIEMFQCLEIGYDSGEVDYESRKRDIHIETDKTYASELLKNIEQHISGKNKSLYLVTYYDDLQTEPEKISTNYFREIAYNLEHTIHHMALIRIGLQEIGNISIDESYGVATSTIKYRQQCVQ
jgi:hypothetical protein